MNSEQVVKSTQEQATAAWITYINQQRITELIQKLSAQDVSLEKALTELQKLKDFIGDPAHILGSPSTKHGEIAENVQVYFSNARRFVEGLFAEYSFDGVGRTAPEDYLKNGQPIQSKFYNGPSGGKTFHAILKHLEKYPDFLKAGGKYEIPKDQYEKLVDLLSKPSSELSRSEATLVKAIRKWEQAMNVSFSDKVNPSVVDYADVQQGAIYKTIKSEESAIEAKDKELRDSAQQASRPSLSEGVEVTLISAALEGAITFCTEVRRKIKEGKKIHDFTADDWKELGVDTAGATAKGGIRGASVYLLTNYAKTPGCVATAFMTALFGVVSQANQLHNGHITEHEFVDNTAILALDVSVTAISSFLGSCAIPIPVLGPLVGNAVGMFLYGIAKDFLSAKEQKLISGFVNEIEQLNSLVDAKYQNLIQELKAEFEEFSSIVELAFSEEANEAFINSVVLADYVGVGAEVLHNMHDIDNYFMN